MDLDKHLIREVKNHRALYDPNHSMYKDVDFKQQAWVQIGRKLIGGEDEVTSVAALKVRWKSLRDAYVKERKYDISKNCGIKVKAKKPWRLKKQMEFLAPFIHNRKDLVLELNDNEFNGNVDDSVIEADNDSIYECKNNEKSEQAKSDKINKSGVPVVSKNERLPEVDSFFRGISDAVKGLSPKNQLLVQKEIATLVMNYKLQELEEEDTGQS